MMSNATDGAMVTKQLPIPLAIPNVGKRETELVLRCMADNWVSTVGPYVARLENEIAAISGVPYGVAVAAGTMGLHIALYALGIGPGDLVILPTYTFIASANAISHCGARPWLFDIDANTWTIDVRDMADALRLQCARDLDGVLRHEKTGERIAAIMPVYTLGTPADMDAVAALASEYRLPVVADAAAALGATYKGRPIGDLADLSVYSFNGNKTITTGGGGMVVGANKDLLKHVKHLTATARIGTDYDHNEVGYNYRMTNIEAAVGCAQLERLEEFLSTKRRIREVYDAAFANNDMVTLFPRGTDCTSAFWFSGVVLRPDAPVSMDMLINGLNDAGIAARKFWKPMHMQTPYLAAPRRPTPVSDLLWRYVLTLPCSTSLSEDDQHRTIEVLQRLL